MAVSDKIKALLKIKGKKNYELAEHFSMSPQAMRNKFSRGSFSAVDLIKIAEFLDCELMFTIDENQRIILNSKDIQENSNNE